MILAVLVACSPSYQTIHLVNRTPRAIEAVYIYPTGAANHGTSRGALAPNAAIDVKVKQGNVDVLAIGAKEKIDAVQSERKEATQTLELRGPLELVFHDSNQRIVEKPGTIGVVFRVIEPPAAAPEPDAPPP